jgi:hypothetical protein
MPKSLATVFIAIPEAQLHSDAASVAKLLQFLS